MRLIDADRLKEVFKRNTGYDYADIIDSQPTAFDVDRVMKKANSIPSAHLSGYPNCCEYDCGVETGVKTCAKEAINIMKEQLVLSKNNR